MQGLVQRNQIMESLPAGAHVLLLYVVARQHLAGNEIPRGKIKYTSCIHGLKITGQLRDREPKPSPIMFFSSCHIVKAWTGITIASTLGCSQLQKTQDLFFCEPWDEHFRYLSEAMDWLWWLGTPAQHHCCLRYQTLMALRKK